ncbi:MAG: indolepyruvate ferredoxin oxidoreductase subunit alpha [Eubacteriales bacterium]|nr:indolepyruvate ferredoxin oxidoreductase subunit alpha [Eubacteriales bacterium]
MRQLLLGNAAVARGLYEAGCRFVSSYPGTPSTEITEEVAKYKEIYAEWAPNEKVAFEAAAGASIGGARAFAAMKHVGLNVAADPLFSISYTGGRAGLVLSVSDDQGMASSQNEQDSRHYARAAKLPMLEPSDSQEAKDFVKTAFELSEEYETPALLRMSIRVDHSQSIVELKEREERPLIPYEKDMRRFVMLPANAIGRHVVVEENMAKLQELAETSSINREEMRDTSIGFVTAGICYQYVREAFPDASVLKLGMVWPLPVERIRAFSEKVDRLIVVEELDPFIEDHCRSHGIRVDGGKDLTGLQGELSQSKLAAALGQAAKPSLDFGEPVPPRPPVLCPGCPHRGTFYTLHKMKLTVFGDIGCYTLGALAPLAAMDTTLCMGASISALHGFNTVRGAESAKSSVAVIGDSTFMHSGITSLTDIVYNKGISTVLILDNSITGMTGHQQNPTTGLTLKGEVTAAVDLEKLCEGLGIRRIRIADPGDLKQLETVLREELACEEPSVILVRRPCALLPQVRALKTKPLKVDPERCKSCRACMAIGCPSLRFEGKAAIDPTQCVGCALCEQLCKFGAIVKEAD